MKFPKAENTDGISDGWENMEYDEEADCYYCVNGQALTVQYEKKEKTSSGYQRTVTVISERQLWRMSFQNKMYQRKQL